MKFAKSKVLPHPWSKDALFSKARRFSEEMLEEPADEWQHVLWSTFVLEIIARAALAHVNPALLADSQSWANLYFALGQEPKGKSFIPKSIEFGAVIERLGQIIPEFDETLRGFAIAHLAKRNEDLHSGATPFDTIGTGWRAQFYQTCELLLVFMGSTLEKMFGEEEADVAKKLIEAANDQSAKSVDKAIKAHRTVWEGKDDKEREELRSQALAWATKNAGHRVKCPSCESRALVTGEPAAPPTIKLEDAPIIQTQGHLSSKFECIACGLKISGLAQIRASGLADTYTATTVDSVLSFYEEAFMGAYFEPDNNE